MATQPRVDKHVPDYHDESRFERLDGRYVERPVPGENHAQVQGNVFTLLRDWAGKLNGRALPEWS